VLKQGQLDHPARTDMKVILSESNIRVKQLTEEIETDENLLREYETEIQSINWKLFGSRDSVENEQVKIIYKYFITVS